MQQHHLLAPLVKQLTQLHGPLGSTPPATVDTSVSATAVPGYGTWFDFDGAARSYLDPARNRVEIEEARYANVILDGSINGDRRIENVEIEGDVIVSELMSPPFIANFEAEGTIAGSNINFAGGLDRGEVGKSYGSTYIIDDLEGSFEIEAGENNLLVIEETVGDPFVEIGGSATAYLGDGNADYVGSGDHSQVVYGQDGHDTIETGEGDDTIDGGDGHDRLDGNDGDDSIMGGNGHDRIDGDEGSDSLFGGHGQDMLQGGDGNDAISGGDGNDWINGGAGDDTMNGNDGDDVIDGGRGADRFIDGAGNDFYDAGWNDGAADSFVFTSGGGENVVRNFDPTTDQATFYDTSGQVVNVYNDALVSGGVADYGDTNVGFVELIDQFDNSAEIDPTLDLG